MSLYTKTGINISKRLYFVLGIAMMAFADAGCRQFSSDDVTINTSAEASRDLQLLYNKTANTPLWICKECGPKRNALKEMLSNAESYGLSSSDYHTEALFNYSDDIPKESQSKIDQEISETAISFCKDLYFGKDIKKWISYSDIEAVDTNKTMESLLSGLAGAKDSSGFVEFIASLEPKSHDYRALKRAITTDTFDEQHVRQIKSAMNYYRWIHHFKLDSFIVVNIPSAKLRYYKSDNVDLEMRAVVGKTNNSTPRFAAYCTQVTLYPYWNMPRSILEKEWLPKAQSHPEKIDFTDMEVVDGKGEVVSPSSIDWNTVSADKFPYRIRQKPGCSNSLGVVKFSLTNPFDVFLHDTNHKSAFESQDRFYSHGCIRLEEPIALADALLTKKVDADSLNACFNDQKPKVLKVAQPVPVFVVYMCAESDGAGGVKYYDDVYGLMK